MAIIALDGRFRELNPLFSRLVGYTEKEFRNAVWPSVSDRVNLSTHRELMGALLSGEVDEAHIETSYLHAHGLLVPMSGTISVVKDETGQPLHLCFRGGEAATEATDLSIESEAAGF